MHEVVEIAEACHVMNMACRKLQNEKETAWVDSTDDVRQSAISGVKHVMANPDITPEQIHDEWMAYKKKQGWQYGETRSDDAKTHPGMVPFSELDPVEQLKDIVFVNTVKTLANE